MSRAILEKLRDVKLKGGAQIDFNKLLTEGERERERDELSVRWICQAAQLECQLCTGSNHSFYIDLYVFVLMCLVVTAVFGAFLSVDRLVLCQLSFAVYLTAVRC